MILLLIIMMKSRTTLSQSFWPLTCSFSVNGNVMCFGPNWPTVKWQQYCGHNFPIMHSLEWNWVRTKTHHDADAVDDAKAVADNTLPHSPSLSSPFSQLSCHNTICKLQNNQKLVMPHVQIMLNGLFIYLPFSFYSYNTISLSLSPYYYVYVVQRIYYVVMWYETLNGDQLKL